MISNLCNVCLYIHFLSLFYESLDFQVEKKGNNFGFRKFSARYLLYMVN